MGAADELYKRQLIWMSTMSQNKIGIESEFCYYYVSNSPNKINSDSSRKGTVFVDEECENEEKIAYYNAISRLKQLSDIVVPQDSIVCVIDSIHDIQKAATKYSKLNAKKKKKNKKKKDVIISGDSL